MNRRFFLKGLIAAPAVVAAANVMPVRSIERLVLPILWGDGIHNDVPALQAMINGARYIVGNKIMQQAGSIIDVPSGVFYCPSTVVLDRPNVLVRGAMGSAPGEYNTQIVCEKTGFYIARGSAERFHFTGSMDTPDALLVFGPAAWGLS